MTKKLTELGFDEENNLKLSLTGERVDATPVGVPIGINIPTHPHPFDLEKAIMAAQRVHKLYTDSATCQNGNVDYANAYTFGCADINILREIAGTSAEEDSQIYRIGAIQFYKI